MLRVRTRPEWPEDNLWELSWDSNPNCGMAKEKQRERERTFQQKAVTKGTAWPWPLREQRTERIPKENWLAAGRPLARQRQRGRHVTAVARRRGAISATEMASSTKLWAGAQLLTMSSWDPGRLTSARRVTAWDQLPRQDIGTPEMVPSQCTRETKQPDQGGD